MARLATLITIWFAACMAHGQAGTLADKASSAEAKKEMFVEGTDGWRFLPADLRFADKLASPDIASLASPAIEAIADFAAQLDSAGISLVVLPVPPKTLVQSASLGVAPVDQTAMKAGWEKIMAELGARDVVVIDLLPDFAGSTANVFCLRDTHWSGKGIDVAVSKILAAAESNGIGASDTGPAPFKDIEINGDLGGASEKVPLRFPPPPASSAEPRLLLLGDSHVLVFHQGGDLHTSGAGLPEQLAAALGFMPEVIGVRGSGATSSRMQLARRVKSKPDYLAGTKLVVWVFAGREFTEADMWREIKIVPQKQES